MEFLQRNYEYSQNIILVNKEFGWALERAPLTALAVGLIPCTHMATYILKELYFSYWSLFWILWAPVRYVVHIRYSQLYASFCLSSSVNKCKDINLVFKLY